MTTNNELRKKLQKLIRTNDWDYDENMAEANMPTPDDRRILNRRLIFSIYFFSVFRSS